MKGPLPFFYQLKDPRIERRKLHELFHIIVISLHHLHRIQSKLIMLCGRIGELKTLCIGVLMLALPRMPVKNPPDLLQEISLLSLASLSTCLKRIISIMLELEVNVKLPDGILST